MFIKSFRQPGIILLLVFLTALSLRLLYGILVVGLNSTEGIDSEQYITYANNMGNGRGFTYDNYAGLSQVYSVRMPGYPVFLALFFKIFGNNLLWPRLTQCILGALLSIQIYLIARMFFDFSVAVLSAVLVALYPNFVRWSTWIGTETLFIFLFTWGIYFFVYFLKKDSMKALLVSGVFFGLSTLTRTTAFTFVVLLLLVLLVHFRRVVPAVKTWAIVSCVVIVVIAPWSIRNTRIHGNVVPFSTQSGISLWRAVGPGVNPISDNRYAPTPAFPAEVDTEYEWDQFLKHQAIIEIKKDPLRFVLLLPRQFIWMWHLTPHFAFQKNKHMIFNEVIFLMLYYPVLLSAFYGVIHTRNRWRELLLFYLVFFNFSFIHIVFVTAGRYRLPVMPFVIIFSAVAIDTLVQILKQRQLKQLT